MKTLIAGLLLVTCGCRENVEVATTPKSTEAGKPHAGVLVLSGRLPEVARAFASAREKMSDARREKLVLESLMKQRPLTTEEVNELGAPDPFLDGVRKALLRLVEDGSAPAEVETVLEFEACVAQLERLGDEMIVMPDVGRDDESSQRAEEISILMGDALARIERLKAGL